MTEGLVSPAIKTNEVSHYFTCLAYYFVVPTDKS